MHGLGKQLIVIDEFGLVFQGLFKVVSIILDILVGSRVSKVRDNEQDLLGTSWVGFRVGYEIKLDAGHE